MLAPGDPIPDVTISSLDGTPVSPVHVARQGPVLLAFFKISCPTCQLALPFLNRVEATGAVKVAAIAQDDAASAQAFAARFGLNYSVWLDDVAGRYPASSAFGITLVPSLFLVERDGSVSWTSAGFHKGELEELGRRAGTVLFDAGVSVPEWKPG